jgi:hypothetical protein
MTRRGVALSLAVFVGTAAAARPEAVAIDHKAVGCIVVGKYPKMNACFTPAASLARSRVYFRPEGVASWYYVDMKSDQPCFTGTLPRPGKKLVGKKIEYYLEAQNKAFEPARTAEFDPIVVKSAQECKKNVPVAPFLNNATVAVFPAVPAGFVGGGIGTAAIIGIAGAGAAAAGTAAVVASNNNNDTTTTTPVVVVNSTTTTTTLAPTTTTTTTLPGKNGAPFAVLTTNPDPPQGLGPLTVTFNLCKSTDPDKDPLSFFFDFGDGTKASGSCLETHTYQSSFRAASDVGALDRSYTAEACVVDPGTLSACRTRNVVATAPPPPTTVPTCAAPTVTLGNPNNGTTFCTGFIPTDATGSGATQVTFTANEIDCSTSAFLETDDSQTVTGSGPAYGPIFLVVSPKNGSDACYKAVAVASNTCGRLTATDTHQFSVNFNLCVILPGPGLRGMTVSSDLALPGGRLQVILNGNAAFYPLAGRSVATAEPREGENRIEATLVGGQGPGTWRFELPAGTVRPGSLRVVSGEATLVTETAVVIRLAGAPGERVLITFVRP